MVRPQALATRGFYFLRTFRARGLGPIVYVHLRERIIAFQTRDKSSDEGTGKGDGKLPKRNVHVDDVEGDEGAAGSR